MGRKTGGKKKEASGTSKNLLIPFTSSSSPSISQLNAISTTTSDVKINAAQSTQNEFTQRQSLDLEITDCLSKISELKGKVTGLQESRKNLEDRIIGALPPDLSLKHQWKLVKKLKNEGNKAIFSFIDNLRKENKNLQSESIIASKEIKRGISMMEQRHLEGNYKNELIGRIDWSLSLQFYCPDP